ncbi:MAG: response regulator [Pseudomonadota bacterium]
MADILAITSSETMALRLRLLIESEGGNAHVAATAAEARRQAETTPPRAIIAAAGARDLGAWVGAIPVIALGEDWMALRRQVAEALAGGAGGEARELAGALSRCRLLLVDDSVTYREFLRHELERAGVAVTVRGGAEEALAAVRQELFDAILLDLVMPGMDGAELCSRLAALRRADRRGFILAVLSSREGGDVLARALDAGADLFLSKSVDMPTLLARLGAALRFKFLMAGDPAR